MSTPQVGILHPGLMGTSVAATVQNGGCEVWWLPEGRSRASRDRAGELGFSPARSLADLASRCGVLLSVCPPHAASEVAHAVARAGFSGLFVDANAISPEHALAIGRDLASSGVDFVDGGILGLPAWEPGTTRLYLSGPRSGEVAALFTAGPLEAVRMDDEIGRASALKMCYAGYTKGTRALLWAAMASAEALGVRSDLEAHWNLESPNFAADVHRRLLATTPKAWRWIAEMVEIAETFGTAGMPREFHGAAGEVYRKLERFRDLAEPSDIEEAIRALLSSDEDRAE